MDYVLYVNSHAEKGSPSACLVAEVSDMHEIGIQDISNISKESLPTWLEGVPTLVRIKDYEIFKGSRAMREVREYRKKQLADNRPSQAYHTSGCTLQAHPGPRDMESLFVEDGVDDRRYSDDNKESRVTQDAMDRYVRLRVQQQGPGHEPV